MKNPERLNLDRRQLNHCPVLHNEQRLRLLNYQHNTISHIQNMENLPNLIFLDLYSNKVASLEGSTDSCYKLIQLRKACTAGGLSCLHGLRVLMAGKNRISRISNLQHMRKLDVLDLHSNDIHTVGLIFIMHTQPSHRTFCQIEHLESLVALRVLNLAGNQIRYASRI